MNISRRDFLKGTAAGALGFAAASIASVPFAFADGENEAAEATYTAEAISNDIPILHFPVLC